MASHTWEIIGRISRKLSHHKAPTASKRERLNKSLHQMERDYERYSKWRCKVKVRHEDFLSAYLHCIALERISGEPHYAYQCEHCGFGHVAHLHEETVLMYGAYKYTAAEGR